jgi:hypothetical protein
MKNVWVMLILVLFVAACSGQKEQKSESFDEQKVIQACGDLISDFQAKLKQELLVALAEGGPENAVSVCRMRAPIIADSFSQMIGVSIKRISLRQRNQKYRPDDFERMVLETFAAAESSQRQIHSEITGEDCGNVQFRYFQEIRVGQPCLKCHGNPESFPPALADVLAENYPDDPAVGYNAGESRGAFAITIPISDSGESTAALLDKYGH